MPEISKTVASSLSKSKKYDPISDAGWKGEKVPYSALASMLSAVEGISSRLAMIELCCNFLRSVIALSPKDLTPSIYLIVNKIAPAYEGLELGVGDALLYKAIGEATGRTPAQLKADMESVGDLGEVALQSRSNQRTMFPPPPLTVRDVYAKFRTIASEHGNSVFLFNICF